MSNHPRTKQAKDYDLEARAGVIRNGMEILELQEKIIALETIVYGLSEMVSALSKTILNKRK